LSLRGAYCLEFLPLFLGFRVDYCMVKIKNDLQKYRPLKFLKDSTF